MSVIFIVALLISVYNLFSSNKQHLSPKWYSISELTSYFGVSVEADKTGETCIAFLDTGVAYLGGHDEKLICFKDFVNFAEIPYDDNGHGTEICSLIFGVPEKNYTGINSSLNYVMLKIADKNGQVSYISFDRALDWILLNSDLLGINVLCIALGFPSSYQSNCVLSEKINKIIEKGIYIVTSSGNDGLNNYVSFPGNIPRVITVGSVDYRPDRMKICASPRSVFSNSDVEKGKPDYYAPGEHILAYKPTDDSIEEIVVSGSSYSACIAAAQIATLKQANDSLSYDSLLEIIYENSCNRIIMGSNLSISNYHK